MKNMKNQIKTLINYIFLLILMVGCRQVSTEPQMPELGIPEDEINSRFLIKAPAGWNTFKVGKVIVLDVEVTSNDQVEFDYANGIRIFALEGNEWIEIQNLMNYPEGSILLSPAKGDPFKTGGVGVVPLLEKSNDKVTLRIVLIGTIYKDGQKTNELTAAYVDILLHPK
jgi:hypothetical protein